MSAFAQLLAEARDRVRHRTRGEIRLHFDWDGTDGPQAWSCWANGICWEPPSTTPQVFRGSAGEEALRRLVEAMR